VLSVLLVHALYQPAVAARVGEIWWPLGNHLDVGLSIFFVISGFLLYRPFVAARAGGPEVSLPAYGVRRVLRIVPAYWVALTVITVWFGLEAVRDDPLRFYGFAQVYSGDTALSGMPQAWTLCVEMPFYLLLPAWALTVRALAASRGASLARSEFAGIGVLIAIGLAWNGLALTHSDPASRDALDLLLVLPAFADQLGLGMLLAAASVAWRSPAAGASPRLRAVLGRLQRVSGGTWWLAALAAWLLACFVAGPDGSPGDRIDDTGYLARHILFSVTAFLVVAPAVFGDSGEGRVHRALAWRPAVWVGTISYSVYLWHFAVFAQVARWWDGAPANGAEWVAWTLAIVAGSLVLGAVSHGVLERPAMRLGRRLSRRLAPSAAAAGVEAPVPQPTPTGQA
jgi:peptidoglycan/LPS O-acetylase OafA/YrhL